MKNLQKYLPLFFVIIFLSGCATVTPQSLGVSEAQWNRYTADEQAQLTADYKQTQSARKMQRVKSGSSLLQVNVQGGRALMPPYSSLLAYQPITFQIKEGQCHRNVPVISKLNPQQKTIMTACYSDHVLYLDASLYEKDKAYGSILLRFMPLWTRGFTYPDVTSSGRAKLTEVNITVKETSS